MSGSPETVQNGATSEPLASVKEKPRKHVDFWIGFGGSIVGNILLFIVSYGLLPLIGNSNYANSTLIMILSFLSTGIPWVLNVAAIILLLLFKRPRIVLGILASYAIPVLAGLCWVGYCFMSGVNI
jgi:hypothetical protein